jgi:aminomethyltransferase
MVTSPPALKQTPLTAWHAAHGAKMVPFGGWEMPLQFSKVMEEHHAVRKACGLFDISHMGILAVRETPLEDLDKLVPQDLSVLYPGKAVYTQVLNPEGGIIDDIIVYRMPETSHFGAFPDWLIICNASNTEPVLAWLKTHHIQVEYMNALFSLIALQGPEFLSVLQTDVPKRFHIAEYDLGGQPVLLSRTGYTGEDGVEILVSSDKALWIWEKLLAAGAKPIGLAARDTLRLEAAYPLHGHELSETITPLEAGLEWSVKLAKPRDFVGKAALLAQKDKLTRHFTCFVMAQKSIPRAEDQLVSLDGQVIGSVTSGSISPTLNQPIGMGYIDGPVPLAIGTKIGVNIRGQIVEAVIVKRPFLKNM